MQDRTSKPGFHALLIGINCYLPNELPSGLYYKSLLGCVQDVDRLATFLERDLRLPSESITKLTSSTPVAGTEPPELPSQWPTYENIVKAIKDLTNVAQAGDQILIHYSGHGGRALTTEAFKELKGKDGIDEVLVPMDLGDSEGRYLRDTELHFLIQKMVQKKLNVTLVLDSCHAGGATRGLLNPYLAGVGVRGVEVIDTCKRSTESLVASSKELLEAWQAVAQPNTRQARVGSGWLIDPQGYVLIAACRANEYANEVVFEGREKNGALSYWLVDTLKQIGPDFTYAMLHTRLLAKIHGQFPNQSPQLQGEGQRVVFDVIEPPQHRTVPVMNVDSNGLISLNVGLAQGVTKGAQFAIYATNEPDITNATKRLAIMEVTEVSPVNCQGKIVDQTPAGAIEPGFHAVRLDGGRIRLEADVRAMTREGQSEAAAQALRAVQDVLEAENLTAPSATKEQIPDFLIAIDGDEYVICDAGGVQVPNLRPAVKVSDTNAVRRVVDRLHHLFNYKKVRELDNNDATSPMSRKFVVELVGSPLNFTPGSPISSQPLASVGPAITISDGDWAFVRIRNDHDQVLNVTVLDLQPDWRISQIYPSRAGSYEAIDPGRELILPLHVTLPDGYESGTDIVKVFATMDTTSFRCLELPGLDQPAMRGHSSSGKSESALELFLTSFDSRTPRAVAVDVCTSAEWVAHQVEIEVVRKQAQVRIASSS